MDEYNTTILLRFVESIDGTLKRIAAALEEANNHEVSYAEAQGSIIDWNKLESELIVKTCSTEPSVEAKNFYRSFNEEIK